MRSNRLSVLICQQLAYRRSNACRHNNGSGILFPLADSLGLDSTRGALISGLDPTSPAASAGIEIGDVVVMLASASVADAQDIPPIAQKPGSDVFGEGDAGWLITQTGSSFCQLKPFLWQPVVVCLRFPWVFRD